MSSTIAAPRVGETRGLLGFISDLLSLETRRSGASYLRTLFAFVILPQIAATLIMRSGDASLAEAGNSAAYFASVGAGGFALALTLTAASFVLTGTLAVQRLRDIGAPLWVLAPIFAVQLVTTGLVWILLAAFVSAETRAEARAQASAGREA